MRRQYSNHSDRLAWVLCFLVAGSTALAASKDLPIDGEVFTVQGHTAFLILPQDANSADPMPWVWYAPTLKGLPGSAETWMFDQFLDQGMAIAGVDVGESYGSPRGRAAYSALYKELVGKRGLAKRACLLARSRGGLMLYNWAVEHPEAVACIAGIYPVCNLSSYPGLDRACGAYDMTNDELAQRLSEHNPIERLAPMARAGVPIFHIHGDQDGTVPLDKNSAVVKARYDTLGGRMTLEVVPGQGHNMWAGWFHSQALVDFVIANARARNTDPLSGVVVTDLRCEYLANPLGIDVHVPRFSWKLVDTNKTRGQKQTAYQIMVQADALDGTGPMIDLWDSGKVTSSTSVNNAYAGPALQSNQNCVWRVRVWDKHGQVTAWSPEARFSMGLLDPSDWQGDWIRYREADNIKHIWYRKTFSLFNRIYDTDLRTYIANTVNGVLMDCPHRERYGYGEVSLACMWGCGIPNYESAAFYTKATRDWFDVQREDGFVNTIAPQVYRGAGGTLWSSAPVTMTWEFYRAYGDKRLLAQGYEPMKKWLDYLHEYVSDDGVLSPYTGASRFLGDWATPHGSEYGYFLEQGETTWPEYWQNVGHDSKIHTCYTSIVGYFVKGIGGILPDPEDYGMKQFIIKPHLVGDLTFAKTTSGSIYGSIKSHWSRSGSTGDFHIEIPVNTVARLYIPARDVHDVLEAGRPAAGAEGVTVLEQDDTHVVLRVDSGVYDFVSSSVPVAN